MIAEQLGCKAENIIDFDLRTVSTEPAQIAGLKGEFVLSGRLDNLVGVYSSLHGLIDSATDESLQTEKLARVTCCFDHEEVGSESITGAQSAVFEQVLKRIVVHGNFAFNPRLIVIRRGSSTRFIFTSLCQFVHHQCRSGPRCSSEFWRQTRGDRSGCSLISETYFSAIIVRVSTEVLS